MNIYVCASDYNGRVQPGDTRVLQEQHVRVETIIIVKETTDLTGGGTILPRPRPMHQHHRVDMMLVDTPTATPRHKQRSWDQNTSKWYELVYISTDLRIQRRKRLLSCSNKASREQPRQLKRPRQLERPRRLTITNDRDSLNGEYRHLKLECEHIIVVPAHKEMRYQKEVRDGILFGQ